MTRLPFLRLGSAFACGLILLLASPEPATSAVLDEENSLSVTLSDGTTINLFGEAPPPQRGSAKARSNRYHYLPVNLRLAAREDGTPEFLFLKFTSEERAATGGIQGGLMHFLMEWGLTAQQEDELRDILRHEHNGAQLVGPARVELDGDDESFQIVSATLSDESLAPSVVLSGRASSLPGVRTATASRLSAEGAQLLAATLERSRSISDVSMTLNFTYTTLAPAVRGFISIDWSRLATESHTLDVDQSESGCRFFCRKSYTYSEVEEEYKKLVEEKVVEVRIEELREDERTAKVREAIFQYFLDTLTDGGVKAPQAQAEEEDIPDRSRIKGRRFTIDRSRLKEVDERGTQIIRLDHRLAVRWPFQITGNLLEWYDRVRDNPKCVASVNLNDPFFDHRDIHFVLDLDAKELFEEVANYVTVNVRKRRDQGHDFEDRVTFTAETLETSGVTQSLTYSRGEDTNADIYEYQAQWSLRGGELYPENPPWRRGSWEGVTLAPPIVKRNIEVEADLEGLTRAGIARVIAQVRFWKFGREVEENIPLSAAGGQPLVSKRIFVDRDSKGFAYRLVLHHKTEGRLPLPWSPKVGDDYIYARIPDELAAAEPGVFAQARAAADPADEAPKTVLDQFAKLLGRSDDD